MPKNTYGSAQKKYYWKNREKIIENAKEYQKEYNSWYWQTHKDILYAKQKKRRQERALEKRRKQLERELKIFEKNVTISLDTDS